MINLLLTLLLLGLMALVVCGFWIFTAHERQKDELRIRQKSAEQAVDREAVRAKRAMNDAAGQPWRNLVD